MAVTDNSTLDKPTYGPTLAPKDALRALLDRLPDTVTLEDIRYHLDVVIKVYEGEASLAEGKFVTHDQFKERFAKMAYGLIWSDDAQTDIADIATQFERVRSLRVAHKPFCGQSKQRLFEAAPSLTQLA
jgi:hypothetical protein